MSASMHVPTSAADALHAEEVRRTRELLRAGWVFAAVALVALALTPGDRRIAVALAALLAVGVAGSVWMHARLRDPARYDAARMTVLALIALACGQLGILYVGAFSAAPLMIALGLYFFCRTENTASAYAIYAIAAGGHAIEAALVIAGVIDDPGFYPVRRGASVATQIAGQAMLQVGYALSFWLARITRRSSLRSISELQRATRLAAQRDVQVAELRRDLDRALEIGGPGRFTGQVVGSWQLANVLGRGAVGEVYEATHGMTGADAAVKLLRRELLVEPRHVERFLREVRVASAIESPHVVKVLEASGPLDAVPFLAMERLRGATLGDILRRDGTLVGVELDVLVGQICSALERARTAGIVHRDLKPQNIMLAGGLWKVLDFGIALLADGSGTLTRGGVVGTPAYMAPEQARGEAVDHRADVYALGAIMYRCLTGRVPFSGRDTPSILYAVAHVMPLRPSALASVSPAAELVLALALCKARDERFASAAELAAAYEAASTGTLPDAFARRAHAILDEDPWTELES
ncbi:MAG: serine/threonine protein kinase [Deltaproteobacteria bacterium]|nr:serine/threonine protein kinase [Deltaproteobacteria bacterium]